MRRLSIVYHGAIYACDRFTEIGRDIPIGAAAVIPGDATVEDIQWAEKVFQGAENAFAK